ncbi:unnamed protein product [Ostreobium quekettii]|uniref:Uncharacterized protein n=1 Tax=Ostreobium quekettii TaxID=121088 RepID=A0A8S1JE03_9CHLO|nr:unnamed protein product [Ostreobium quekettii]|eukprot:evm.model.scf_656.1 EVM.evm.TU.scf_656.1   scf_656:55181-56117(+)
MQHWRDQNCYGNPRQAAGESRGHPCMHVHILMQHRSSWSLPIDLANADEGPNRVPIYFAEHSICARDHSMNYSESDITSLQHHLSHVAHSAAEFLIVGGETTS